VQIIKETFSFSQESITVLFEKPVGQEFSDLSSTRQVPLRPKLWSSKLKWADVCLLSFAVCKINHVPAGAQVSNENRCVFMYVNTNCGPTYMQAVDKAPAYWRSAHLVIRTKIGFLAKIWSVPLQRSSPLSRHRNEIALFLLRLFTFFHLPNGMQLIYVTCEYASCFNSFVTNINLYLPGAQ